MAVNCPVGDYRDSFWGQSSVGQLPKILQITQHIFEYASGTVRTANLD
jgi:hypothetical protein